MKLMNTERGWERRPPGRLAFLGCTIRQGWGRRSLQYNDTPDYICLELAMLPFKKNSFHEGRTQFDQLIKGQEQWCFPCNLSSPVGNWSSPPQHLRNLRFSFIILFQKIFLEYLPHVPHTVHMLGIQWIEWTMSLPLGIMQFSGGRRH